MRGALQVRRTATLAGDLTLFLGGHRREPAPFLAPHRLFTSQRVCPVTSRSHVFTHCNTSDTFDTGPPNPPAGTPEKGCTSGNLYPPCIRCMHRQPAERAGDHPMHGRRQEPPPSRNPSTWRFRLVPRALSRTTQVQQACQRQRASGGHAARRVRSREAEGRTRCDEPAQMPTPPHNAPFAARRHAPRASDPHRGTRVHGDEDDGLRGKVCDVNPYADAHHYTPSRHGSRRRRPFARHALAAKRP